MYFVRVKFDGTFSFRRKCLDTCCAVISWDRTDRRHAQLQEISRTDRRLVQLQSNALFVEAILLNCKQRLYI